MDLESELKTIQGVVSNEREKMSVVRDTSEDTDGFLEQLEIAKALSLETLELDRIRRERLLHSHHVRGGGGCSQVTSNGSSKVKSCESPCLERSSSVSVEKDTKTKLKINRSVTTALVENPAKGDARSRPRPSRQSSLNAQTLPPPPRRQGSPNTVLPHSSGMLDLMTFSGLDDAATRSAKSEHEFDPLLHDSFSRPVSESKTIAPAISTSSTPPVLSSDVLRFDPFNQFNSLSKMTGPSVRGPLPLDQWNFPPPVPYSVMTLLPVAPSFLIPQPLPAQMTATLPVNSTRISLRTIPPAPTRLQTKSVHDNKNVLKVIEKKSDGNLIDLSFFDTMTTSEGSIVRKSESASAWSSEESADWLESFDPLLTKQQTLDQSSSTILVSQPKCSSGQYFNLWESKAGAKNENDVSSDMAPPVPLRKHSKVEQKRSVQLVTETGVDCVELRHNVGTPSTANRQRNSRVYKSLKVMSDTKKSTISEIQSFRDSLVRLRREFTYDDYHTNTGLVISPNLERLHEEPTSIKLAVYSTFTDKPVSFTCDVNTSIEHVISQIVCTIFDDISHTNLENYVLKVHGMSEYFTIDTALADYEYVHHCQKFDEVVRITLLETDVLQRSLARTFQDDKTDVDIALSKLLPTPEHCVSPNNLAILIETVESEIKKLKMDALEGQASRLQPQGVIQAVKVICNKLSQIETKEIMEALDDLVRVVLYFAEHPVEVGHTSSEAELDYSSIMMSCSVSEAINRLPSIAAVRMQLLVFTLERVNEAVRQLLDLYCRCFFVRFEVPTLHPSQSIKDVTLFNDTFLVNVASVHRLQPGWENFSFVIGCELYHGTRLLADEIFTVPVFLTKTFYPQIIFDEWIEMRSISLCILPRETRLCCTLYGIPLSPVDSKSTPAEGGQQEVREVLAWAAFQLFDYNGELYQGGLVSGMWSKEVDKRLGPAVCNTENPNCSVLRINLPDFGCTVIFPPAFSTTKRNESMKRDFERLDKSTQERLLDILLRSSSSDNIVEDREFLWEKKSYLYDIPQALPKVLLAAHSWDWSCLMDIYHMISEWKPMDPLDALELLLPCFPDIEVRKMAISWIKNMNPDELCDYLPQLVQALKYETYEDSPMARFLLEKSLTSIRIMHHLYWLLKQNLKDLTCSRRIHLLMNSLTAIAGKAMRQRIDDQEALMQNLYYIAEKLKCAKDSARQLTLHQELVATHSLLEDSPTCLPLSPSFEVCGVNIKSCSYFTSKTLPLKLNFKSVESGSKPIEAIFKDGDDLRQDMLVLQMIRIMDKLWLKEGLNLKIVTFGCIPTDDQKGIVELVKDAETLRKIQTELGLTGSFKDRAIAGWLQKYNISELEYQQAVDNFTLSCAGYSVATYILGICDRHNDNIMIKKSGHIFHIDFGKFLGDSQMFGAIKRDRVPFVFTADMAYVINGGDKPSDKFQHFIDLCCQAFNTIRKHGELFLHLFSLMVSAGIRGVTMEAISAIQCKLMPEKNEYEAAQVFTKMIEESLKSWSTSINFFFHNLAQLKVLQDPTDSDTLLSFIPRTYTMETDGKLERVEVVGYHKCYDPEKYYAYIICAKRVRQPNSNYLFRSYSEFCEFQQKLCALFPLAKYRSLPKVFLGRSNVRQVAEKRKNEIDSFLKALWNMADEVKHCDLVYTFFHPLLRDQQEDSQSTSLGDWQTNSQDGLVTGQVSLMLHYKVDALFVMVRHARNLSEVKGQAPDPYVKLYLVPDPTKETKRKTRVARKTCHPTFMEMMVYQKPLNVIQKRILQVSIWNSGRVAENVFLGGLEIDLSLLNLTAQTTEWYTLGNCINVLQR